jgi:hypothetical protein
MDKFGDSLVFAGGTVSNSYFLIEMIQFDF